MTGLIKDSLLVGAGSFIGACTTREDLESL